MISEFDKFITKIEKTSIMGFGTRSFDNDCTARVCAEENDGYRTPFQRDRDRIIHSRAFRRLMHKTQVFVSPDSDHMRTRLTHSLEVMQIARTIARCLHANEDLTEAIALGHDLGHAPFGHKGEEVVAKKLTQYGHTFKFTHGVQSWRIVTQLEGTGYNGKGLNLTSAVRFGVLRHSGAYSDPTKVNVDVWDNEGRTTTEQAPQTLEEQIVRVSDDIAWVNHDWEDGVRSGILSNSFLSDQLIAALGGRELRDRVGAMVRDVVDSYKPGSTPCLTVTKPYFESLKERVKKLLWMNPLVSTYSHEAEHILESLFDFFMENPAKLPADTRKRRLVNFRLRDKKKLSLVVADYISGMTDEWCLRNYQEYIYSPYSQTKRMVLRQPADWVLVDEIEGDSVKFDPDHDWRLPTGTQFSIYRDISALGQKPVAHCRMNNRGRAVCNRSQAPLIHKGDTVLLDDQQTW